MRNRPTVLGICVIVAVSLALLWGSPISLPWHAARADGADAAIGWSVPAFPPQVGNCLPYSQPSVSSSEIIDGGQPPSAWGWAFPTGPVLTQLPVNDLAETVIPAQPDSTNFRPASTGWGHTLMQPTVPGDWTPTGTPQAGGRQPHGLAETAMAAQENSPRVPDAGAGWGHTLMQQTAPGDRVLASLADDRSPVTQVSPARISAPPPTQGYDEDAPTEASSADDRPAADPETPVAEDMFVPIGKLNAQIAVEGDVPDDPAAERFSEPSSAHDPGAPSRGWPIAHCHWKAPGLRHQPLYFEDPNLERHGFSAGKAQPLVSGARFFGTVGMVPYLMVVDPPDKCRYTLGHYRPGSPVPPHINSVPCRWDATTVQAAAVTAAFIAIP